MFCLFIVLAVSPIQAVTIDDGVSSGVHYGQPDHPSSLVFIDAGVRDKQLLLSSMAENTKAIILRHDSDGVQQITDALQEYRRLESIQIISHGTPGQLMLGSTSLTGANLHRYQYDLQTWGDSLKPQGGILLYGCNVAQGAAGDRFVDRISNFTGAPIAASTDITGSTHLGGNWVLEKRTETIVVTSAIGEPALSLYNHLLAPPGDGSYDVSDTFSTPAGTTRTGVGGYPTNTQWDSTWSSLTYDGGPIDTWITGIARLGSGFGDYIDIADAGYTTNTDANTHWFRVTADNVNAASFELTDIVLQNYLGSDNFDVTVTGYRVGGGTVQATTTYASAAAGSISSVLGPFSGVQITSFDLAFSTSNSSPIGDFTFVSFGIANAAAPVTTPTVTGISPSSGPTTGSTSVTITGSNFTGTTGVTIGGSSATGVTVVNDTTITATTPAGTVGAKDVVVTNASGSGTGTGLFTYVAAPTVTGISPSSGPATGGTSVTITGTNLTGATSVTIGGASATSVSVVNSTTITATTPSGTPGARDVAVTTVGGTGTGTGLFTYIAAPTVTGITPSSGPTAGGTNVTITGTNLTGATGVTIGGASATSVSVVNSTTITATTPSGTAGTRDVVVTTPGGTGTGTGLYTYYAVPTVTGISPSSGPTTGGTSVTITGTNLTGATGVTIGGASATSVSVVNSTTITATTPSGTAGARDVVVTTPGGTGTGTGLFTYIAAPTVTGITPSSGPTAGGTNVTITGTNLTGATGVTIGGASATSVSVVNSTTITATTPSGTAGARDVAVTTPGGTGTGTGLFTYVAAPTVTGISPSSGPAAGGTSVTITGTNLTGATSVTIGGASATSVSVVNSTTITATTPSGTAGARDVAVTTPGGTGTGTGLFTYVAAPTVTGISPSSGPTAGGTNVTITGTNLTGATGVTIGGASATSVSVVNSTTITATTPSGTAGARDVAVTTVGGTGTGTGLFTYIAAPTVTNISPDYGATTGSTSVTITGTNLTGATSVTIGGASATGVSVVNSTTITATTPAGTAGARDVAVTTVGGTGTGTGIFTYIAAPTVTGISPSSGPTTGGDSVTITGTSFTGTTSVTIGGSAATGVAVVNDTTITATTPAGTAGAKDVIVTNSVGSGTGTSLYTYVAAPTVTGISPASGTDAGGTGVTITGTNLTGATGVTIGGSAATGITVINSTTITATTPAGTAGARDVTVTTIGGTGTGTGLFTYLSAPGAPTGATASGGDTQATVNFTAPTSDGGSTITTYTATSSPGGLTGTCAGPAACAITVTGLTNGTVYTFTVTATNAIGTSAPSAASNSVTPAAGPTVPDAPTGVTATAGYGQATINFSAPASDGGSAITIYTATSSPGGLTGTCTGPTACAITVTGLTGGTAYTFTVTATNAVGTGAASVASNSVTVVVRPDPTQDADVIGLVDAQARTANRFWRTQTSNYHQRLESLHHATRKRSASADTLLMKSDSLSLATDSESFAGAGRGRLQSMVVHDPAARIGDDIQPEGNDIGSELLMPGIALAKDIANALNTSSLNINLAAFDYGLESSAGNVAGFDIWGAGNVRIGKRESHDGSSKIDYSTDGVTFGIDHWFSDNLLLGMGIGYAHDDSEIGSNGSENTSDGKSIALYASYQPGDSMFIDGVLGYGTLDMDSSRYDTLTDSTAYASRDGEQLFGSIAVGYEYLNESTLISPYARYDIAVSRLDSATETGAGIGLLNYADQTYTSKQISLGLRAGFQHKTDSYLFQPRARIEYQHHIEGGDDASIAYADTLSTRYNMAIPSNNSNSLLLGVGSIFVLRNGLNLDIDYQWSHSNDDDDSQAIFLRVSMPLGGD